MPEKIFLKNFLDQISNLCLKQWLSSIHSDSIQFEQFGPGEHRLESEGMKFSSPSVAVHRTHEPSQSFGQVRLAYELEMRPNLWSFCWFVPRVEIEA